MAVSSGRRTCPEGGSEEVFASAHRTAGGAEQHEDEADDEHDDADRRQDADLQQQAEDQQDEAEDDHVVPPELASRTITQDHLPACGGAHRSNEQVHPFVRGQPPRSTSAWVMPRSAVSRASSEASPRSSASRAAPGSSPRSTVSNQVTSCPTRRPSRSPSSSRRTTYSSLSSWIVMSSVMLAHYPAG